MDSVGILVVSKSLSAPAMVDAFARSEKYRPELYVVERQRNPFNVGRAKFHTVSPQLSLNEVAAVARKFKDRISFGVTDTEDFVVSGGRDFVERESGVQMVCVSERYAVERSKAEQRALFERTFTEANPSYSVFDPAKTSREGALSAFKRFAGSLKAPVIKPDAPARGAGVGVWGSEFSTAGEMSAFFLNALSQGKVVVEEKVEGEESSFQAFSDGKHFVPCPLVRDYKRGLDGNAGKLTGGMGSYSGPDKWLPFISEAEWSSLASAEEAAFRRWKGEGSDPGLRGVVLYDAIMHTARGFKVLERNSRGGNTELVNVLTTMYDDFVDACFRMTDGTLKGLRFSDMASVVTCAVPLAYGDGASPPKKGPAIVDFEAADALASGSAGALRVYPMDVRLEDGKTMMGQSRTAAVVGVSRTSRSARKSSLEGLAALRGPLRWRDDIASDKDILGSAGHLASLRRPATAG